MSQKCPYCGCTEIEIEPSRGDSICTKCGIVLSEHNIVSEVQFLENSRGGSSAVGQFVSSELSSRKCIGYMRTTFSRESKEITLGNAYKKIKSLSQQLRLKDNCIAIAHNFFKLALNKGLTRGRKNDQIIGACVYITCRTSSTPHMLIDVSDALHIDVYQLGRTYLRLSTALCISIPTMDPCLYIYRFAHKLSFGDKTHEVSETALRLLKRMKRDWLHTGRRPSGLCGAALVISARLHNYNRTISDVIKVVKVHESTLRKRLTEFGETPSSALTPEEFMNTDLEEEQDPPAFRAARLKEKEKLLDEQVNIDEELKEIQEEIESHLEDRKRKLKGSWAKYKSDSPVQQEERYANKFITEATLESIDECISDVNTSESTVFQCNIGIGPSAASLGLKESIAECMEIRPSSPVPEENGTLDLTGIDDEEIDSYIMSERERKLKTELWMKLNKEYIEELAAKEEREKQEEEERKKEGKPPKKKKTYNKRAKCTDPANTAGEAIEKMLLDKKLSNKINYDVLKSLSSSTQPTPLNDSKKLPTITMMDNSANKSTEAIHSVLHTLTKSNTEDEEEHNLINAEGVGNEDEKEGSEEEIEEEEEEEVYDEADISTAQLLKQRFGEESGSEAYYDSD